MRHDEQREEKTAIARLKVSVTPAADEAGTARVASIRASLPHQAALYSTMTEAALRFGLPMTGREIHDRVRKTLPRRWRLPVLAWVGLVVCSLMAATFLGFLPYYRALTNDAVLFIGVCSLIGAVGTVLVNLRVQSRTSVWTGVSSYTRVIPDAALLKFAEAAESGLFTALFVVEPGYETAAPRREHDPWLVGCVGDQSPGIRFADDDRRTYVVLAYWE